MVFGNQDDVEFLDLKDPKTDFHRIPIEGLSNLLNNPMIFISDDLLEAEEIQND